MERTSSCTWVRALAEMFAAQGLDAPSLLRSSGIDAQRLERVDSRFGADEVSRLWEAAAAASGSRPVGLDRELAAKHLNFDMVGFAMLSSADLRSALASLAQYLDLISSATTFHMELDTAGTWLVMGHTGHSLPIPWQRSAYSMLALLTLCRWATRREIRPLAVGFAFMAPGHDDAFVRAFDVQPRFAQPDHRLLLAAADLACAIPSRNAALLALHERVVRDRLAALGNATTSYRVSGEIIRRLDRGEPRRPDVAASLALTDRTLQRRLREENTSFQELLDAARGELAR